MYDIITPIYICLPLIIAVIGLTGNVLGFIVTNSNHLTKIGPLFLLKCLFIADSLNLLQMIATYLQHTYGFDIFTFSSLSCKLLKYFGYQLTVIPPMIMVYIWIYRLVIMKYPSKRISLLSNQNQIGYLLSLIAMNLIFYSPVFLFYDINLEKLETKNSSQIITCSFMDSKSQILISTMDLCNRVLVPFILIIIFSSLFTAVIFDSRKKFLKKTADKKKESLNIRRDVKVAISLLVLNFLYVCFNLPISLFVFLPNYHLNSYYLIAYYYFYSSFAIKFYIFVYVNSKFRNEFLNILSSISCIKTSSLDDTA